MINYVTGDATYPQTQGPTIVAHVCNDKNGWGAGFVLSLSKRWLGPEKHYRALKSRNLGDTHIIKVEPDIWVANMIAQSGYGRGNRSQHRTDEPDERIPLRYDALASCLSKLSEGALKLNTSVSCPRLGCSLAGGSWKKVEALLQSHLIDKGIQVTVYDFPGSRFNP